MALLSKAACETHDALVLDAQQHGAVCHKLLQRWQLAVETGHERGKITFHSVRHSTATAAIASGANVQTVSSLLGHANPQITLTTYADQWAARLDQATALDIVGVLFGSETVAEGKKAPTTEGDLTEESAENSESYDGGPCRDRTYDQEIKSRKGCSPGLKHTPSGTSQVIDLMAYSEIFASARRGGGEA